MQVVLNLSSVYAMIFAQLQRKSKTRNKIRRKYVNASQCWFTHHLLLYFYSCRCRRSCNSWLITWPTNVPCWHGFAQVGIDEYDKEFICFCSFEPFLYVLPYSLAVSHFSMLVQKFFVLRHLHVRHGSGKFAYAYNSIIQLTVWQM